MEIGIFLLVLLAIMLIPAFVARSRHHRNTPAIAAVCILFGWSVLGWLIALVWALTDNVDEA